MQAAQAAETGGPSFQKGCQVYLAFCLVPSVLSSLDSVLASV